MFIHLLKPEGGEILRYRNETEAARDVDYASATAEHVVYVSVEVDEMEVDGVWVGAGSSHSWWTGAGGKLLRRGLDKGQTLRITATGPVAFRLDWQDE